MKNNLYSTSDILRNKLSPWKTQEYLIFNSLRGNFPKGQKIESRWYWEKDAVDSWNKEHQPQKIIEKPQFQLRKNYDRKLLSTIITDACQVTKTSKYKLGEITYNNNAALYAVIYCKTTMPEQALFRMIDYFENLDYPIVPKLIKAKIISEKQSDDSSEEPQEVPEIQQSAPSSDKPSIGHFFDKDEKDLIQVAILDYWLKVSNGVKEARDKGDIILATERNRRCTQIGNIVNKLDLILNA